MTLLERTRARAGICTRCARHEPYPGLLTCRECTERLVAPPVPEWRRNLAASDKTGWVKAA